MLTLNELIEEFRKKIDTLNDFKSIIESIKKLDIGVYNQELLINDVENYVFFDLSVDLYKQNVIEKIKKDIFNFKKI